MTGDFLQMQNMNYQASTYSGAMFGGGGLDAINSQYDQELDDLVKKAKWDTKLGQGRQKIFEVRKVCNDVMFIDNYLTPEFVERFNLYTYEFNRRTNQYEIAERDFKKIKEKIMNRFSINWR